MAIDSSTIAWKITWTEEPRRLHSPWGRKESDTTERLYLTLPALELSLEKAKTLGLKQFWQVFASLPQSSPFLCMYF